MERPKAEWEAPVYQSLERPPEYFGCHKGVAIAAIMVFMGSWLGFPILPIGPALLLAFGGSSAMAAILTFGRFMGKADPWWPQTLPQHLFGRLTDGEDYLDV